MRRRDEPRALPATDSGPRPADFPLGSVESRAAVRAMINRRAAQDEKAPTIHRASWVGHPADEDFEILDINTRLPVAGDTTDNGMRSDVVVQHDKELQDALTVAHPEQAGKARAVPHRRDEEYEILDLP